MYKVFDEFGSWVARCADFYWAKKTADHYSGYVTHIDECGDEWLIYDAIEDFYWLISETY